MRTRLGHMGRLLLAFALVIAFAPAVPTPALAVDDPESAADPSTDTVLVEVAEGTSLDDFNELLAQTDSVATESVSEEELESGYVRLELADGADAEAAQSELVGAPQVEVAQPNFTYQLLEEEGAEVLQSEMEMLASVNDPEASIKQGGTVGKQYDMLDMVNAFEAWDMATCDGGVTIVTLDAGCDLTHPDLAANVLSSLAYNAASLNSDMSDVGSHGTHVAGIAGAVANNGKGVAGLSYNAHILPLRVVDVNGYIESVDVCRALAYVADCMDEHPELNIRVANMSFGAMQDSADGYDVAMMEAVELLHEKGVLFVAACGNNSDDTPAPFHIFPADFSCNVMSVINAVDETKVSSGSNYNVPSELVKDISAPGSNIYSTTYNGKYGTKSGTSMAAPCVAGIAALVFAANPDLTNEDVIDILCTTAVDMYEPGYDEMSAHGLIDAEAAVRAATQGAWISGPRLMAADDTVELDVSGDDKSGYEWSSSDESVAMVVDGTVTGVGDGFALITASKDGEELVRVMRVYAPEIDGKTEFLDGGTSASIDDWSVVTSVPGTWVWESSDEKVVSIADNGRVRAWEPGTATITAWLVTDPGIRVSKDVVVEQGPRSVEHAELEGVAGEYTYTGSPIAPVPSLVYTPGAPESGYEPEQLVEGTHYTYYVRDNVDVGTAELTIIGIGPDYTDEATYTFEILPRTVADATVTGISDKAWTGSAVTQSPKVVVAGRTLKLGTDYTLSYSNNVNAGTATVTIKGKGNYTGSAKRTFVIKAGTGHVSYRVHRQTYGWETSWKKDGATSGTTGQSKRLESIYIKTDNAGRGGTIQYRTHIQSIGWEKSWKSAGQMSGTTGQSKRLEAIQIKLTGAMATDYDVYYRVHAQHFGWMGWAKNGASAGTAGYSYRLEAIQIRLVKKGASAPGSTANPFRQKK